MNSRLAGLAQRASRRTFGETGVLTHGATTIPVAGEFDDASVREDLQTGAMLDSAPRFSLMASALSDITLVENTDTLTLDVSGTEYVIREIREDGQGSLLLILRESA